MKGLTGLDPKLAALLPLLEEAAIHIREGARELERYGETLDIDAARQETVERRLAAIEELARKHRVTPLQLRARAEELRGELETLERADVDLAVCLLYTSRCV